MALPRVSHLLKLSSNFKIGRSSNLAQMSFNEQLSELSMEVLQKLYADIGREISRRTPKPFSTELKEWTDRNKARSVKYYFNKIDCGMLLGTVVVIDEYKNELKEQLTYEDRTPGAKLKKPLKELLAEEGVRLLQELQQDYPGDSFPHPVVTKKELDDELDEIATQIAAAHL